MYFRCLEDSKDAIMITDREGKLVYVNPAWERTYEYGRAEAIAHTPGLLHSGEHDRGFYEGMWASILDPAKGYWKGEIVNRSKTGKRLQALLMITPYRGPDGEAAGYIGIATDISEQKRNEERTRRQESMATLRYFADRLAHETGTILGVIRGRSEFILSAAGSEKVAAQARTIVAQTDRIAKAITYLRDFCKNMDMPVREEVRLGAVIEEGIRKLERRITEIGIKTRNDIKAEVWLGDRKRLGIIVSVLLENAVDAIEFSSKANPGQERSIHIRPEHVSGALLLRVHDTGGGIPSENLSRIFRPFFTTKDVGGGIGIGLALASRLADDMSAVIRAESQAGKGSVFTVELPT